MGRPVKSKPVIRWGIEWNSSNRLDGERRFIVMRDLCPALFKSRREARAYRDEKYGYIKGRPDLKAEPHGWTLPRIVRVECRVVS